MASPITITITMIPPPHHHQILLLLRTTKSSQSPNSISSSTRLHCPFATTTTTTTTTTTLTLPLTLTTTLHVFRPRPFFGRRARARACAQGDFSSSPSSSSSSSSPASSPSPSPPPSSSSSSWIHAYFPAPIRPFALLARLDKPIGTWLLVWPYAWSIALAAPNGSLPDLTTLALFGVASIILRGAGCTVNDLLDREFDRQVERTKSRPIASGAVTPFQGLCFLVFQLLLHRGIVLRFNEFSQILGAANLLFVGAYPLFKRWTYWPQAFLGLTINWGALLGWAALKGSIQIPVIAPLYLACICWTLVYDTIYAHQDKSDDIKVGVKSTALYFGDQTQSWLTGFAAITIGSLLLAGYMGGLGGWPFYCSILGAAIHLYWQIATVDINNPADCNAKFVSNQWFGVIVFAGIVAGKLVS